MAAQMTFRHGDDVRMIDHTPTSAVTAGDVLVIGYTPCVAHRDIDANVLGALAIGGGVYRGIGDAAIAKGKKVWWDDTNNKVSETSSGNHLFGITVSACAADAGAVDVYHKPDAA